MVTNELLARVQTHTLLDQPRLKTLYENAVICKRYLGAFAELGVYKGGAALLMHMAAPNVALHLFDTFSGMPEDDCIDSGHRAGDFHDTSAEAVRELFNGSNNVLLHKGVFPESTERLCAMRYSLVHMDADIYQSTMAGIQYFWPRLVPGGRIVFDDYEWKNCPGVKRAITEFCATLSPNEVHLLQEAPLQMTMIKEA